MVKNIVFDIGNVLLDFHPKQYFANMYDSVEKGEMMCDLIMQSDIWKHYDLGVATLDDVKKDFVSKVPQCKDEIIDMLDRWLGILKPIRYSFDKMEDLKQRGYKVYLLSNLSEDAFLYIEKHFDLFNQVDGYIVSYQEHVSKPDFKIYECLMERYNLQKEECVFLDDTLINVEASNAFGMKAIHFVSEKQVENVLEQLLEG